jgi:hypothetical protein
MSDNLVTCNHCGSHLCYEIKINETQNAYSCVTCGFSATDLLKDGEYDVEGFEESFPELYKDLKFIDEDKRAWYPLYMQNEIGIIFLDGTDKENWGWAGIKNRPLTEAEQKVYTEQGKEVPPHKSDSDTMKHFGKLGFLQALDYIGFV